MALTEFSKKFAWDKLTSTQKHMILMYMYRIETDIENIEDYIETHHFRGYSLRTEHLPSFVLSKNTKQLKELAYAVIGKALPKEIL